MVWEDDSNKNNIYQIYARGFYANGSERFGDITVNSVATGQQLKPVVAMGRKVILSHCFISTVAGGTSLEKDVQLLRTFRDQVLRNTKSGKLLFDKFYNKYNNISSMIVKEMNKDPQVRGIVKWAIVNPIVNYLKLVQSFPDSPINNLEEPWQSFLKKTQDDLEGWAKNCLNFAASQIEFDINKYLNKFTPENLVTEINLALTYIYRNEQARIDWLKQLGELNLIPLSIDKEEKTKIIEKLKILGRSESEIIQILGK